MTTKERLEKLEQELADVKGTLRAVVGEAGAAPRVVRAGRFVLEDENGKVHARLDVGPDGTDLRLFDDDGQPRTVIAAYKAGPAISLLDATGAARVWLNTSTNRAAQLALLDEGGNPRVELSASVARSGMALADENGHRIWTAP